MFYRIYFSGSKEFNAFLLASFTAVNDSGLLEFVFNRVRFAFSDLDFRGVVGKAGVRHPHAIFACWQGKFF